MYNRKNQVPPYLLERNQSGSESSQIAALDNDGYYRTGGSLGSREQYTKKGFVRLQQESILRPIASSADYSHLQNENALMRTTQSLDPFPSQLPHIHKRTELNLLEQLPKLPRGSFEDSASGSTSANRSNDNNCDEILTEDEYNTLETPEIVTIRGTHYEYDLVDSTTSPLMNRHRRRISDLDYDHTKHTNNNCNGSITNENPSSPLLIRQGSLCDPHDDIIVSKKWRSLETVGDKGSHSRRVYDANPDECRFPNKRSIADRIATTIAGIFHGNGFRSSDASLRKIGAIQSGLKGMAGFGEIPASPEKESIV